MGEKENGNIFLIKTSETIDITPSEHSAELNAWLERKPPEKRLKAESEDSDEEEEEKDVEQFKLPDEELDPLAVKNYDEFGLSIGDLTSIESDDCSISQPPYKIETAEQKEEENYRYKLMKKILKYLLCADQTSTVCVFNAILSVDLRIDQYIYAIEDTGSIELLINMCEMPYLSCQLGALEILYRITRIPQIQKLTVCLGLGKTVSVLLRHQAFDIVTWALKIITNLTKTAAGRTCIRKNEVIPYIVMFADIDRNILLKKIKTLPQSKKEIAMAALFCIRTLRNLSKAPKCREALYDAGLSSVIYDLVKSKEFQYILNALYIFLNCVRCSSFKAEFQHFNVHDIMIDLIDFQSPLLGLLAARYMYFVCDSDEIHDKIIAKCSDILDKLLNQLTAELCNSNQKIYNLTVKLLHKITRRPIIMDTLHDKHVISKIYKLTNLPCDMEAEIALWEILADLAIYPENLTRIWNLSGIEEKILYNLQFHMFEEVKGHIARMIGLLVGDLEIYMELCEKDIFQKLWGQLYVKSPNALANICRALLPVMKIMSDLPNRIRNIVGSVFRVVEIIENNDPEAVSGGILVLSKIVQDQGIFEVMSDIGGMDRPFKLLITCKNPKVRSSLCYLIASLAMHDNNNFKFGRDGYISLVINDVKSPDFELKIAAAYALWKLSEDPVNCMIIYKSGVCETLLENLLIDNKDLQSASAGCLYNIRNLAFNAERKQWLYFNESVGSDDEREIKLYQERVSFYETRGKPVERIAKILLKETKMTKKKEEVSEISLGDIKANEE